jgi:hypothetical protein
MGSIGRRFGCTIIVITAFVVSSRVGDAQSD